MLSRSHVRTAARRKVTPGQLGLSFSIYQRREWSVRRATSSRRHLIRTYDQRSYCAVLRSVVVFPCGSAFASAIERGSTRLRIEGRAPISRPKVLGFINL